MDESGKQIASVLATTEGNDVILALPEAFDLSLCGNIDACRRVIAESGRKIGRGVQFGLDPERGTVEASVRLAGQAGRLDPELARDSIRNLISSLDKIAWTMWKAMYSGDVTWVSEDFGPSVADATVSWTPSPEIGEIRIASWVEREIFASTLIAFDELGRNIVPLNDIEAERFGRSKLNTFRHRGLARFFYRDWVKFWNWVKMRYPPVSVRVWGKPMTKIKAVVRSPKFLTRPCEAVIVIDGTGESEIDFLPDWNRTALLDLEISERVEFDFEFFVEAGDLQSRSDEMTAAAIMYPTDTVQLGIPLGVPIATRVEETHPWIDGLVGQALELGVASAMGDSPTLSRREQWLQIFAVWKAFRDRRVVYSDIANADASREGQRVRRLHECLEGSQANCIDGTAAMASVLAALGFEVCLVTYPGHAALAIVLNDDGSRLPELAVLETTLISSADLEEAPESELNTIWDGGRAPDALSADWRSFVHAESVGSEMLWSSIGEESLHLVPLTLLRNCGMRPIPTLRSRVGSLPPPPGGSK
jgi:hypothetical protein